MTESLKHLVIVCGHYGSGKTTFAVNLALKAGAENPVRPVHIADLDIVNPYFRTADAAELLRENGIDAVLPAFANSNVDIPVIPPKMIRLIEAQNEFSVIDVGGDDGAVALGMFEAAIKRSGYSLFFVVNRFRPLISEASGALDCMKEIEKACGLRCTHLVNNSCLGAETKPSDIVESVPYAKACAEACGLPLWCHTCREDLLVETKDAFIKAGYGSEILMPVRNVTRQYF